MELQPDNQMYVSIYILGGDFAKNCLVTVELQPDNEM